MQEKIVQNTQSSLEERFIELCTTIGHANPEYVFGLIKKFYTRRGRFYHNLALVRKSLQEFYETKHLSENPTAVEIALFFKDLVFEHYLDDSKPRSARFALNHLKGFGVERELACHIYNLVLASDPAYRYSDNPYRTPQTIDEKIMADIDSSIFGKSTEEYDKYEENIKKEYLAEKHKEISEDQYVTHRVIFLQRFLEVSSIYLTDFFREKYEKQAKENIEKRLTELREKLNNKD